MLARLVGQIETASDSGKSFKIRASSGDLIRFSKDELSKIASLLQILDSAKRSLIAIQSF